MCYMNLLLEIILHPWFTKKNCCIIAYVYSAPLQWWLNCNLRRIWYQEIRKYRWNEMKSWNWCLVPSLPAGNSILLLPFWKIDKKWYQKPTSNFLIHHRASILFEIERQHGIATGIFRVTSQCQKNRKISVNKIANVQIYWDLITLLYIFCISPMVVDVFSNLFNVKFYPQQLCLQKN